MSDLEKRWSEYFFFGGPQPSLMEGVRPITTKIAHSNLKHIEVKTISKTYKVTVRVK